MRFEAVLAILSCVTLSLSGCGGSGPEHTASSKPPASTTSNEPSTPTVDPEQLLEMLNSFKDSTLNPLLASSIPDPLEINELQKVDIEDQCLVPKDDGDCALKGSVTGNVTLKKIEGLSHLNLTEFTDASLSADIQTCLSQGCSVMVGGTFTEDGVAVSATFDADVRTESFPLPESKNSGAAATQADLKGHFSVSADATVNSENNCYKINITKADLIFDDVSIHDMSVTIESGALKMLNDAIKDALGKIKGDQAKDLFNGVAPKVLSMLVGADLPCVNNPLGFVEVV